MASPLLRSGVLRYAYEVEIGGVIHPMWGFPQINRDLNAISATCSIPNIGPWPDYAVDLTPITIRMALNSRTWKTMFRGVVSTFGGGDFPPTGNIQGIDELYKTQIAYPEEVVWRAKYAHEIIGDLLTLSGITDFVLEPSGWLMATVEPIVLKKDGLPIKLIRDIDIAEDSRTITLPSGVVVRRRLPLYPGAAVSAKWKYAHEADPDAGELWVEKADISKAPFSTIKNRVVVEGITLPGIRETVDTVQEIPVPLGYVPTAGSVAVTSLDGTTAYIEDTDFSIDYTFGLFTSLEGGAIANGDTIIASYNSTQKRRVDEVETLALPVQLTYVPVDGSVTVEPEPGNPALEEGTHYDIDYELGTIVGTNVLYYINDTVTVSYSHAVNVTSSPIRIVQKASNSSLPANRYITENIPINAQIVQDPYRAALIAIAWIKNLNRTPITGTLTTATNLDIVQGDNLSYRDPTLSTPALDLTIPAAFLVTGYTIDGPSMTIRLHGGKGGAVGELEPVAPFSSFDWRALAVGDIVLLVLYSTSHDLNDDIVSYNWNGDGYISDSTIYMVFDTTVDTFFTASLQAKDATELEGNIYARGIDLLGAQEDIDSGRYKALTILQVDEGTVALVMGGHREYVGPGSEDLDVAAALIDTGSPYFSYTRRYLTPGRSVLLPRWDDVEEHFTGAHTADLDGIYDVPRKVYVSTLYGGSQPIPGEDGAELEPGDPAWNDYLSANGLASAPQWVWQWWDQEIAAIVSVADGVISGVLSKRPGVYIQVFPMTPLEDNEPPPWSNEKYFRYATIGEGRGSAAMAVFPINPKFLSTPPWRIDYWEMPEVQLGAPSFLTEFPRENSRDLYVEADGAFPGQPVWISPEGTIWLATNQGVYFSNDQGVTWIASWSPGRPLGSWADRVFAGNYTMDGEEDPVYRYGYKWGAVAGSGDALAVAITGWSVGRDNQAAFWYDYHTEEALPIIYKGHRSPILIIPYSVRPTFPEDIEVRDLVGLLNELGFVVNGKWVVLYDEGEDAWTVTEITYTYPVGVTPPDLVGTRFTPHPSEPSIFLISEINGDYWAYMRTVPEGPPTALTLLGKRDSPIPGAGSYIAVTDQSTIPILPYSFVTNNIDWKVTKATVEPAGYRDLVYNDSWWSVPYEFGE